MTRGTDGEVIMFHEAVLRWVDCDRGIEASPTEVQAKGAQGARPSIFWNEIDGNTNRNTEVTELSSLGNVNPCLLCHLYMFALTNIHIYVLLKIIRPQKHDIPNLLTCEGPAFTSTPAHYLQHLS